MVRAAGYAAFVLGLVLGTVAGFVFFAAFSDFRLRGCAGVPGAEQCADAVGVLVLSGCAITASLVLIFAGAVLVRR